jgi:hypothetical protein
LAGLLAQSLQNGGPVGNQARIAGFFPFRRDYAFAKNLVAADHVALGKDVIFAKRLSARTLLSFTILP